MKRIDSPFKGLIIIEPRIFNDSRGYFYESYQDKRYGELGIPPFVQDNFSHSQRNTLRGLHYQLPSAQGKLVGVTQGEVWDVVVDIRQDSPTFKQWFGIHLSEQNHIQMYVPPGFAHGFCVLSETANFYYKCTDYYNPATEKGIIWNDSELNIPWPLQNPIISSKDLLLPSLSEITHDNLFA